MNNYDDTFKKLGLKVPEVLLPSQGLSYEKWAVIACDQYTSQPEYWEKAAELTDGSPSTLNMIFPECYLEDSDSEQRIADINKTMEDYISNGTLSEPEKGFILLNRSIQGLPDRWGLVAALDLEFYDYSKDSTSLIRATEGTILDRIPPRVRIRENAALELPHIMVLIDDPEGSIIEPLTEDTENLEKVYDFDLMMNSGHIAGYRVNSAGHLNSISAALEKLGNMENLKSRYNSDAPILYAMGDGNHSLATAKTIWETYKKNNSSDPRLMQNPSRWALVELVNIYSKGIAFEAIHRVLFNLNPADFLTSLRESGDFKVNYTDSLESAIEEIEKAGSSQLCAFCHDDKTGIIEALTPSSSVTAGTIQKFIDSYLETNSEASVDYIHGIDVTRDLGSRTGNIGIFLPAISKDTFFKTVIKDGAFPRKTFSMGEAAEKRFYIECRAIR